MKTFSFEKLTVWQKAIDLSEFVYTVTRRFPDEERFGLISQMRRCSVSVISNISEGSGRRSGRDKARFTEMAYSSALELMNQTILSERLKFISLENYKKVRMELTEITAMLDALHKSQFKQ